MSTYEMKPPGYYYFDDGSYDLTGHIGELFESDSKPLWPMYSFSRPSRILWNAIGKELFKHGWTDVQIKTWLQSKCPRYALDCELEDALSELGVKYAQSLLNPNDNANKENLDMTNNQNKENVDMNKNQRVGIVSVSHIEYNNDLKIRFHDNHELSFEDSGEYVFFTVAKEDITSFIDTLIKYVNEYSPMESKK